jgi:hypothetical protein
METFASKLERARYEGALAMHEKLMSLVEKAGGGMLSIDNLAALLPFPPMRQVTDFRETNESKLALASYEGASQMWSRFMAAKDSLSVPRQMKAETRGKLSGRDPIFDRLMAQERALFNGMMASSVVGALLTGVTPFFLIFGQRLGLISLGMGVAAWLTTWGFMRGRDQVDKKILQHISDRARGSAAKSAKGESGKAALGTVFTVGIFSAIAGALLAIGLPHIAVVTSLFASLSGAMKVVVGGAIGAIVGFVTGTVGGYAYEKSQPSIGDLDLSALGALLYGVCGAIIMGVIGLVVGYMLS